MPDREHDVVSRALRSAGRSNDAIYAMVRRALRGRVRRGRIVDVGAGVGNLKPYVDDLFDQYAAVDVVRYDDLPAEIEFHQVDVDTGAIPLPDRSADAVVAVETIEHLENPRAFVRELVRLAKPGGQVVVTTPNQSSYLSLMSLVVKDHFVAFQDANYPEHITALLPADLRRIATECGLEQVEVRYSGAGRIPGTGAYFPGIVSRLSPRRLSDNVLVIGRKP